MSAASQSSLARRGTAWSLLLLVIFLAAWEWGPGLLRIPSFIIPPLSAVAKEAVRMWEVSGLLKHTSITAAEVLIGFIIGSLMGACIGYAARHVADRRDCTVAIYSRAADRAEGRVRAAVHPVDGISRSIRKSWSRS